jgi:hypothetical protein
VDHKFILVLLGLEQLGKVLLADIHIPIVILTELALAAAVLVKLAVQQLTLILVMAVLG